MLLLRCERLESFSALGGSFVPELYDWPDLVVAVRDASPASVVVIDPYAASEPTDHALARLVAAAGMTPVVAVVPLRGVTEAELRGLLAAGVADVLDTRVEGRPEAAPEALDAVKARPLKRLLERNLSRFVSFDASTLIRAAAEVTVEGGGAEDLAEIFAAQERTVSGWCAREALPPPRRLLAWLRLILALALVADVERPIVRAAEAAGYTDASLRRALRTFLGGGRATRAWTLADVFSAFNAELAALREAQRAARRSPAAA